MSRSTSKHCKSVAMTLAPKLCDLAKSPLPSDEENIALLLESELVQWFVEYEAMKQRLMELGHVVEDYNSYLLIKPLKWAETNQHIAPQ
jgi:hypothetical protein